LTPTPARLKLLSTINAEIDDCVAAGITGKLIIEIPFHHGGIGQLKAEIKKNLTGRKKGVANIGILCLNEK